MGVAGGLRRAVWNPGEQRLRAPLRIPAAFLLGLLAVRLAVGLLRAVTAVVPIPGPVRTTLALLAATGVAIAVTWFVDRRHLRDVGLGLDRGWWTDLLAGLAVGLGMVLAVVVALVAAGLATVGAAPTGADIRFGGGAAGVLYGFLFFCAVGLLEEYLLRGYLLVNAAEGIRGVVDTDRAAVVAAVLGTAGLFGVLHAANPGGTLLALVNIMLAGVLLGSAVALTGRLAFPIGVHATWNFGLGPLFGLPVSGLRVDAALVPIRTRGPATVTGGEFGPEGGLVMLLALAVGAVALGWWVRRRGRLAVDGHLAVPDLWISLGSADDGAGSSDTDGD